MSELISAIVSSISGLSAILIAVFGVVLSLRELRNRDRRSLAGTISELRQKLATSRANEIILLDYSHTLRKTLVSNGYDLPHHPELDIPPERKSIDFDPENGD